MKLRVVAIPFIAAICLGSPALANSTSEEQQVRGRGARDRNGGGTSGGNAGENRGAGNGETRTATRGENRGDNGGANRTAQRRDEGDPQAATRTADRAAEPQRYAVPKDGNRDSYRDNVRTVVDHRPNNVNYGSSYRSYGSSYYGPRYYSPVHVNHWARSYYGWSPIAYAPWSLIYGSIGFSNFGFYGGVGGPYYPVVGYNSAYGYGPGPYSPWQVSGPDVGGVRLKIRPRDAQVFVDGYYAGIVDDFDGSFQSLRLEQGGHKIEIHMPGFQDYELDVHVQAGKTITLSEDLKPRP